MSYTKYLERVKRGEIVDIDNYKPIVEQFVKSLCPEHNHKGWWKDYLAGYWEKEKVNNKKILIATPDLIMGIVFNKYISSLKGDIDSGWNIYTYKGLRLDKNKVNVIKIEGFPFRAFFLKNIIEKFFENEDIFEIRVIGDTDSDTFTLLIKINDEFSLGCANAFGWIEEYTHFIEQDEVFDKGFIEEGSMMLL